MYIHSDDWSLTQNFVSTHQRIHTPKAHKHARTHIRTHAMLHAGWHTDHVVVAARVVPVAVCCEDMGELYALTLRSGNHSRGLGRVDARCRLAGFAHKQIRVVVLQDGNGHHAESGHGRRRVSRGSGCEGQTDKRHKQPLARTLFGRCICRFISTSPGLGRSIDH